MKKVILYTAAILSLMTGMISCSDFGDVNNDPEHMTPTSMDYRVLFTTVVIQSCGSEGDVWRNGLIYGGNMMQHTSSINWIHGIFYTFSADYNSAYWDNLYSGSKGIVRDLRLIMNEWKDNDAFANDYQMCRILRAYVFHRMTDLYGDIPYSEAGQGYEGIGYPKYDKQEDIYNDILKELDEAQAALDPAKATSVSNEDLFYKGDVSKWKKFANSLMLRVAMRLTNIDPAKAKEWTQKAVNNGLFENASDNAILYRTGGDATQDSSEPYGKIFGQRDPGSFFVSEYFINMLKETNDPRLPLIATVCTHPEDAYNSGSFDYGDNDPDKQIGLPSGYDANGGEWDLVNAPGAPKDPKDPSALASDWKSHYSVPCRYTYGHPLSPTMMLTYTENQFLLAEAAYRGWISDKSVKEYYESGVRSAMEQFSFYPNADAYYKLYLNTEAVNQYLEKNPFNESKAMEQIATQYWITTFCDSYETFANWRRTGYPALTPVNKNYPSTVTNGTIPRRFTYPIKEAQVNAANYKEAVSRISGGDKMTSRVWWDKE